VRELALFAGAGGGILGGLLLGWRTVCAVEIDAFCRSVLLARQRDGLLEPFPIWDDVCTFDGKPWRGHVDVISGGFPCQDISSAGKRAGITGERSGLWSEFARIIGEVRPSFAFVENSPDLTARGLEVVLGDLAALGYDARWDVLGARHVGAPHRRDRIWIVATDADRSRERAQSQHAEVGRASPPIQDAADLPSERPQGAVQFRAQPRRARRPEADSESCDGGWLSGAWWSVHRFAGVDDGMAHRVDRVRATGNGQVPAVAALAWETLT
jgi:DNA (cytosine-5)-methyltransferase 1